MSDTLDKARAALQNAKEIEEKDGRNTDYLDMLAVARTQADIAQAEALMQLADTLDDLASLIGAWGT